MSIPSQPIALTQDLNGFFVHIFPQPIVALVDPTPGNNTYNIGQVWINKALNRVWFLTNVTAIGVATWTRSSVG